MSERRTREIRQLVNMIGNDKDKNEMEATFAAVYRQVKKILQTRSRQPDTWTVRWSRKAISRARLMMNLS